MLKKQTHIWSDKVLPLVCQSGVGWLVGSDECVRSALLFDSSRTARGELAKVVLRCDLCSTDTTHFTAIWQTYFLARAEPLAAGPLFASSPVHFSLLWLPFKSIIEPECRRRTKPTGNVLIAIDISRRPTTPQNKSNAGRWPQVTATRYGRQWLHWLFFKPTTDGDFWVEHEMPLHVN